MMYTSPVTVGNVTIPNRIWLAPMAGVSDLPFRLLCRRQGAGLAAMEMISAKAVCYGNRATIGLMKTLPEEAPVSTIFWTSIWDVPCPKSRGTVRAPRS